MSEVLYDVSDDESTISTGFISSLSSTLRRLTLSTTVDRSTVEEIERPALGNYVELGALYNQHKDRFLENEPSTHQSVNFEEEHSSATASQSLSVQSNFASRIFAAELASDIKLNLLSGMTKADGWASYFFSDELGDVPFVAMIYSLRTKTRRLALNPCKLHHKLQTSATSATHVVTEIQYGVRFVFTAAFTCPPDRKEDTERAHQLLQSVLAKKTLSENERAELANYAKSMQFRVFTDPGIQMRSPRNLDELEAFEDIIRDSLEQTDGGRGVPIAYRLATIASVLPQWRLLPSLPVDERDEQRLTEILCHVISAQAEARRYHCQISEHSYCLSTDEWSKFEADCHQYSDAASHHKSKSASIIVGLRRGKLTSSTVDQFHSQFCYTPFSPAALHDFSNRAMMMLARVDIAQMVEEDGISYIGKHGMTLQSFVDEHSEWACYVLVTGWEFDDASEGNYDQLKELATNGEACAVLDSTVVETEHASPRILKIVKGAVIDDNYLEVALAKRSLSLSKFIRDHPALMDPPEASGRHKCKAELPCPNAPESCPCGDFEWTCDDCSCVLRYDGTNFLCECGSGPMSALKFRCRNFDHHGPKFTSFGDPQIAELMKQLDNFKEKNVLVIGPTGIGKSTWINSFAMYLTHPTFEEAEVNEVACLVRSKFSMADEQGEMWTAEVGPKDDTECEETGASATQLTKGYCFPYKCGTLRVIDTPGVCDTRGIDQDKVNCRGIIRYLDDNVKGLHGICFLLPPNNARLTNQFKYCIEQLLTKLHRNATRNIVFCYTNANATHYRHGDSRPTLEKHIEQINKANNIDIRLNKDTEYYLDNEAFRYLCMRANGMSFSDGERLKYKESYTRAQVETKRLINYIAGLPSHNVSETVTLNEARQIIVRLSHPLASISHSIKDNIVKIEDHQKRIANIDRSSKNYAAHLLIPRVRVESSDLPYPRTVCTATKCREMQRNKHGEEVPHYKKPCHDHCYLEGVPVGAISDPQLRGCWAISSDGTCHQCGCAWTMHMHITFDQHLATFMEVDPEIQLMLDENKSKEEIERRAMQNRNKDKEQLEREHRRIVEILSRFGAFMSNAMLPSSDAIREYILLSIRDAEVIAAGTNDYRRVDGLRKTLDEYDEEVEVVREFMNNGNAEPITPLKIKAYLNELFSLRKSGNDIKELWNRTIAGEQLLKRPADTQYYGSQLCAGARRQARVPFASNAGYGGKHNRYKALAAAPSYAYSQQGPPSYTLFAAPPTSVTATASTSCPPTNSGEAPSSSSSPNKQTSPKTKKKTGTPWYKFW